MNRFKRILSALVIAAMALSLMPTFASATVGDSIVYDFNESTDASYSATSVTSYTDAEKGWMYYDMTAGKAAAYLPSYNPNYIQITSSVGQYFAIKIKVPESGKYDMSLVCYQHATIGGSADMYLLPGTTKQENIAALIETAETVNGNDVLFYADKNTYPTTLNVAFDYQILAGEYVLVFKATGISPYMTNATHISKQYAYMYPATLTLTKTAEAEDDGEVTPPEEEKKDPITLTFNNGTVSGDNQTYMNALASSSDDFSIVAAETMGEAQGAQYSRANAINLMFRAKAGTSQQNYFKMIGNETDANAGKFTVQANNIPAGTYKVDLNVTDNARGIGAYVYVGNKYVGFCDTYKSDREWGANPADTDTKEIGYVTIVDEDNNAETTNTVKIAICSAAIDASSTTSNYLTLKSITFTPVDAIPAYGDLTYEVTGATAAGDGYTVENNTTLSLTAMLSGKHLNGYKLDGAEDADNCIRVTSSDSAVVSVTDTKAALDSAKIYASDYKPVYTLTALKSNASADITVEAIVDGIPVAFESFKVTVAKSDADEYEAEAVFAWGTTLPSELSGKVTVSEKDGGTVNAGEITASKGATYTFKATEEITVGEITYKFIGWKRGTTSNGAAAFISYEPEDEYTVW
ncbi:MAG: hypothetical protein IJP38_03840, partial [Oscillospiraceae bacterium]|nr:hypothetical protein [Oscillospiraceae bacterium]